VGARGLSLRLAIGAVAAVATVGGIDALADLTQTRPDPHRPRSRSEVVLEVRTRDPGASKRFAAEALWGACQSTARRTVIEPGMQEVGDARFRIVVQPALGRHARDRLTGCLQDLTIEEILGTVISMREIPVPGAQNP
jgi:hypothetical protein